MHKSLKLCQLAGKKHFKIGLIEADGIGKEVIPAAARVLSAVGGDKYEFIRLEAGFELFQQTGVALPKETLQSLKTECDGALFGAVSSPSHKVAGYSSPIVQLRKELDLYANVRPVVSSSLQQPIDMLIIRENTECLYVKRERESRDPATGLRVAIAERQISEFASRRIAKVAFDSALKRHSIRLTSCKTVEDEKKMVRPKVTIVHKANVLSVTDGLFRECVLDEYNANPAYKDNIQIEEQLVDSMVYRMFREPQLFDVVVAPNMYGDIVSDAAAALVGSLGMVAGANVGDGFCVGEPVHGSAPDIYGKGIANPIASIRSAALLLEYLNQFDDASRIMHATDVVISKGILTPDMKGSHLTEEVTDAIINELK